MLGEGEGGRLGLGTRQVESLGSWGAWDYGEGYDKSGFVEMGPDFSTPQERL